MRMATQLDDHARELETARTTASVLTKRRQNTYETAGALRAAAKRATANGSPMEVLTPTTALRAMRERRGDVPAARRTAAEAGHETEAARTATVRLHDAATQAAATEDDAATTAATAGEAAAETARTADAAEHAAKHATLRAQNLLERIERDETTSRKEIEAAERALADGHEKADYLDPEATGGSTLLGAST